MRTSAFIAIDLGAALRAREISTSRGIRYFASGAISGCALLTVCALVTELKPHNAKTRPQPKAVILAPCFVASLPPRLRQDRATAPARFARSERISGARA